MLNSHSESVGMLDSDITHAGVILLIYTGINKSRINILLVYIFLMCEAPDMATLPHIHNLEDHTSIHCLKVNRAYHTICLQYVI